MPVKPAKKTERNKRALPEIQTNPVSSPLKKPKASSQDPVPLGQLSQSEEEPTQTSQVEHTQADTIIDCSQTDDQSITSHSSHHNNNNAVESRILEEGENSKLSVEEARKGQPPPSARWAHTMTHIGGNRILVYGGQTYCPDTGCPMILSDIHVYDLVKKMWYKPVNCEGVPRQWHTATYLPERQLLISFGGETINPKTKRISTTDEVMVLDTEIMVRLYF